MSDNNFDTSSLRPVSRLTFLYGAAALSSLAACGKLSNSPLPGAALSAEKARDVADLMRRAGVLSVDYKGVRYNANGKTEKIPIPVSPMNVCPQPLIANGSRKTDSAGTCSTPEPPTIITITVHGSTGTMTSGPISTYCPVSWSTTPYYTISAGTSPTFNINTNEPRQCTNPLDDARDWAEAAAHYIEANPGNFPSSVVAAAQGALNDWQGDAEMGAAASAEFFAAIAVGLTFADFLAILVGIGVGLYLIYELWECIEGP